MMPDVKTRTFLWGATLAAGAAVVGHAAIGTKEGPAVDTELFVGVTFEGDANFQEMTDALNKTIAGYGTLKADAVPLA
jgi:hypothetical protein